MAVNVKLLNDTLDAIKANPEHWQQRYWHCETSHCFAGFAELLSLGLPLDSDEGNLLNNPSTYNDKDGHWNTRINAVKALGLDGDYYDTDLLFSAHNSLEDLEKMVAYLAKHNTLVGFYCEDDEDNEDSEGWSNED